MTFIVVVSERRGVWGGRAGVVSEGQSCLRRRRRDDDDTATTAGRRQDGVRNAFLAAAPVAKR